METEHRLDSVVLDIRFELIGEDGLGHLLGSLDELVVAECLRVDGFVTLESSADLDHVDQGLLVDLSPGDVVLGLLKHSLHRIVLGDDHTVVDPCESEEAHGVLDVVVDVGLSAYTNYCVCHLHSSMESTSVS